LMEEPPWSVLPVRAATFFGIAQTQSGSGAGAIRPHGGIRVAF